VLLEVLVTQQSFVLLLQVPAQLMHFILHHSNASLLQVNVTSTKPAQGLVRLVLQGLLLRVLLAISITLSVHPIPVTVLELAQLEHPSVTMMDNTATVQKHVMRPLD
jgi:hypothetical protein